MNPSDKNQRESETQNQPKGGLSDRLDLNKIDPVQNIESLKTPTFLQSQISRELVSAVNSEKQPELSLLANVKFQEKELEYVGNNALNFTEERAIIAIAFILDEQLKKGREPQKINHGVFANSHEYSTITFSKASFFQFFGLERKINSRGAQEIHGNLAHKAIEALNKATKTAVLPLGKEASARNLRGLLSFTPESNEAIHKSDLKREISLFIHETYYRTFEEQKQLSFIHLPSNFFNALRTQKIRSKYVYRFVLWVAGHNFEEKEYYLKNTLQEMEMTNLSHRRPEVLKRINQGIEVAKKMNIIEDAKIEDDKIYILRPKKS